MMSQIGICFTDASNMRSRRYEVALGFFGVGLEMTNV